MPSAGILLSPVCAVMTELAEASLSSMTSISRSSAFDEGFRRTGLT